MAADFLESLANIAPTHIILGNHDLILSNKNRLDSVTPVVEALANPNSLEFFRQLKIDD